MYMVYIHTAYKKRVCKFKENLNIIGSPMSRGPVGGGSVIAHLVAK
jgi:hypothetical protein